MENLLWVYFLTSLSNTVQVLSRQVVFTPLPVRAVGVLFSPTMSGWAGVRRKKIYPGCVSETVRYRKLILGRDIGWGFRSATSWSDLDLTFKPCRSDLDL